MQVPSNSTETSSSFTTSSPAPDSLVDTQTLKTALAQIDAIAPTLKSLLSESPMHTSPTMQQEPALISNASRSTLGIFGEALQHLLNLPKTTITVASEQRRTAVSEGGNSTPVQVPAASTNASNTSTATETTSPAMSNSASTSLIPAHARTFDRTGEIEWRPRLSDGKLAIIFRAAHVALAEKVQILSPDGKAVLATGTQSGVTGDGRPTYTFDRPGAEFPDGSIVMMTFHSDKGVRTMTIPETSERYIHGGESESDVNSRSTAPSGTTGNHASASNNVSTSTNTSQPTTHTATREFERTGEIEWRPRLNDGNLSIIFRRTHETKAERVQIFTPDGHSLLATGKRAGSTTDGRPVYEFDRPGSSFPDGAVVVMQLKDGEGFRKMIIPDTAEKYIHGAPTPPSTTSNASSTSSRSEAARSPEPTPPVSNASPPAASKASLVPPGTREFERTGQIEWRPRLNNGNLSILFRTTHASLAEKVQILSADGTTLLATGVRAGTNSDGRPVYNFDQPGANFPDGAIVVMTLKNSAGTRMMKVHETAEKFQL